LRISIATAEDATASGDADAPALAALGVRVGYHSNDYRWNRALRAAVRSALLECAPAGGQVAPGAGSDITHFTSVATSKCDPNVLGSALADAYKAGLDQGFRAELALNAVFAAADALPSDKTDWRSTRGWLALEQDFGVVALGGALDESYRDTSDALGR
jgi:hypothetical protein